MVREYHEKISRRLCRYRKALIYSVRKPLKDTLPVFIMGCGRSGTTMMINIFHRDHRVEALGEDDPKIAKDFMLDFDRIANVIRTSKALILVMKPILNSFDGSYVLKTYSKSRVLWIVRDYKDMIASSVRKFGTEVATYMQDFIVHRQGNNWLSRGIPLQTCEIISGLDISRFTPYDWMGLIWWSVNRTVILDRLFECDRFLLVKYEALVRNPEAIMRSVYEFIGLQYQKKAARYMHAAAIGKGVGIELDPQVEGLCQDLASALIR